MHRILEICCASYTSALAAQSGRADRIELCTGLELDGLTPSAGMLLKTRQALSIPIFVLIRPRAGNFCYSEDEIEVMLEDTAQAKALGADGIVCGALHPDGRLHYEQTARLVEASHPLPFTFHRAFDVCTAPLEAIDQLAALGVSRILTSGGAPNAPAGAEALKQYIDYAGQRLRIMAGGGIRPDNLAALLQAAPLQEVHSSARLPGGIETSSGVVEQLRLLV
ncbi:MAG: copper homeostasis protein CutC [Saprospiraceae bacterium]|jgi:copper homeostasis protein|nr:copper homeostasis protein CutC [Saprospiraceae bacterium]